MHASWPYICRSSNSEGKFTFERRELAGLGANKKEYKKVQNDVYL